ncbi:hypothetical protein KIN20_023549 [Parelaphostrongylus tenuis]|uniref:Uncharacterized protein n=1 Tax=Parelaphostrongylus tenuis TaxID=148309 RepID=A0AAD5NA70_PARTN|nr:hypothetical protein KIN20_023549 [Parelaphostrongylus tenuis]
MREAPKNYISETVCIFVLTLQTLPNFVTASTRNFIVTGFSLPVSMVYSTEATVRTEAPGIAPTKETAKSFVERLVMQTVSL